MYRPLTVSFVLIVVILSAGSAESSTNWRGLTVADEHRCSEYDSDDYRYRSHVEADIVAQMGVGIYGPYTGTYFESASETDIEHMIARSEAHDSGLCAADAETKRAFAEDLDNLTLASPSVNRHQKSDKDAAEWLPEMNQCWFADRVVKVRQEYNLTIDRAEANALDDVFAGCTSFEMIVTPDPNAQPKLLGDKNGDGTVSASEVLEVVANYFAGLAG